MKDKKKLSVEEKLGLPYCEFKLKIPLDYDHDTRLNSFRRKIERKWFPKPDPLEIDRNITSENFNRVTNKLIPGKNYIIKLIPVLVLDYENGLTNEECLEYLHSTKSLLVGAHGLSLLYEYFYKFCPQKRKIISFEERKFLWVGRGGRPLLTYLQITGDYDRSYGEDGFKTKMYDPFSSLSIFSGGDYLLCFFED